MTKTMIEYVWIGGNQELRSKTKVINQIDNSNVVLRPRLWFGVVNARGTWPLCLLNHSHLSDDDGRRPQTSH